jgi:tetratricopeptide (TPR) repeat protein
MMNIHAQRWPMHVVAMAVMLLSGGCISMHSADRPLDVSAQGPLSATAGTASESRRPDSSASVQALYDEARRQIALQQWVIAMQWLDKALMVDPSHVESLNARAGLRAQYGDLSGAHADLRDAIEIDPSRAHLHFNFGLVHQLRSDAPAARQAFERALELDPSHERARLALSSGSAGAQVARPVTSSTVSIPAQTAPVTVATPPTTETPAAMVTSASTHDSLVRIAWPDPVGTVTDADRARVAHPSPAQSLARSDVVVVRASPPAQTPIIAQDAVGEAIRVDARIGIANGNGVAGLARALKLQLAQVGPYATTTRNWVNFEQRETRVYHRPGFEIVANKVSQALPIEVPTGVLTPAALGGRDVLVVLGQDIKSLSGARVKGAEPLAALPVAKSSFVSSRSVHNEATDVSKL